MIGADHVAANKSALKTRAERWRNEEVIDTPADIPLADIRHRTPPGIMPATFLAFPEGIHKTRFDECAEPSAFFRRDPVVADVCFRVRQVQFGVGYVEVPAENDRFFP